MKRETLAGFWAVGLVLLLFSFALPWPWHEVTLTVKKEDSEPKTSITSSTTLFTSDHAQEGLLCMFSLAFIIASFLSGVYFLVLLILWSGGKALDKAAELPAFLCLLLLMFTPLIFGSNLPSAKYQDAVSEAIQNDEEFPRPGHPDPANSLYGSYNDVENLKPNEESRVYSWGPGTAFYVSIISFILLLTIYCSYIIERKGRDRPPVMTEAAPAPGTKTGGPRKDVMDKEEGVIELVEEEKD